MGRFYFKGFSVAQTKSAIKVNSDGVLLAAWSSIEPPLSQSTATVLDVGSGTGVISLIVAKRLAKDCLEFHIDAIDIDRASWEESVENFANSPWAENLSAYKSSLQSYVLDGSREASYDLIISNPPYFSSSLRAEDERRSLGRHDDSLTLEELLDGAQSLLKEGGMLSLILPATQLDRVVRFTERGGVLSLWRVCRVVTREGREAKRVMLELVKGEKRDLEETLLTMQPSVGDSYSDQYIELVCDYYLKPIKGCS